MEALRRAFFRPFKRFRDTVSHSAARPLCHAGPGVQWRVVRVCPDSPELCRLCELGLTPGCSLRVLQNDSADRPLIIEMGESRMCLTPQIAEKVWVESTG